MEIRGPHSCAHINGEREFRPEGLNNGLRAVVVAGLPSCSTSDAVRPALHFGWPDVIYECVSSSQDGLDMVGRLAPDVVVVDTCVPNVDWLALTREMRRLTQAALVNIACQYSVDGLIEAVEAGADDYMPLPLNHSLFVARVRAALHRAGRFINGSDPATKCGDLEIDADRHEARVHGCDLRLSPTEFEILFEMARRFGRVARHETLSRTVWREDADIYSQTLRKYIQNLRRKLAEIPGTETSIVTVHRIGYKLVSSSALPSWPAGSYSPPR